MSSLCLDLVPVPRREVLLKLRTSGPLDVETLSEEMYLSPSAVRQHLGVLAAQGLVSHEARREGPGRPRHLYRLTPLAEGLFPQGYASFATELMATLDELGLASHVLGALAERVIRESEGQLAHTKGDERLRKVAAIMEERGFASEMQPAPGEELAIKLVNCPVWQVVERFPQVCETEERILCGLLGAPGLKRVAHRFAGDAVCEYASTEAWGER